MKKGFTDPRHYQAIAAVLRQNGPDPEGTATPPQMAEKLQTMADFRYNQGYDRGQEIGYSGGYGIAQGVIDRSITEFSDHLMTKVGDYAFYGCSELTDVDLPALTQLGKYAFSQCSSLETVNMPLLQNCEDSNYIFAYSNLQQANFPLLEKPGKYMFPENTEMTAVNLPKAQTISNSCFANCKSLQDVSTPLAEVVNEQGFYGCQSLESLHLPKCYGLCLRGFYNCTGLQKLDISRNVTVANPGEQFYVDAMAFYGCSSLTMLVIRNKKALMPLKNTNAFDGTPIAEGTGYIYVPGSMLERYKAATNWAKFAKQFRAIEQFTGLIGG